MPDELEGWEKRRRQLAKIRASEEPLAPLPQPKPTGQDVGDLLADALFALRLAADQAGMRDPGVVVELPPPLMHYLAQSKAVQEARYNDMETSTLRAVSSIHGIEVRMAPSPAPQTAALPESSYSPPWYDLTRFR